MRARLLWMAPLALVAMASPAAAAEPAPVVQHLAAAIRFQTVSHQDPERFDAAPFLAFRRFVEETYPRVFSELAVTSVSEHSLLIEWSGSRTDLEPVLFEAHYDVVPVEPGTQDSWTHPPFDGVIDETHVWGRGALDDKAAVIALFEAMEGLLGQGFSPERTLLFAIGHDEEVGGSQGAGQIAALLTERGVRLAYMVGEGGSVIESYPLLPDRTVAMIGLAEKTYLTLRIRAVGPGGHSSSPPEDYATVRLARAITALHENPFDAELVSPVSEMLEALAPHMGGFMGLVLGNQWATGPVIASQMASDPIGQAMVRTTMATTMLDAGVKENVIPQQAEATMNLRLLPGHTPDDVIERIRTVIDDENVTVESNDWGLSPPVSDPDGEGYAVIRSAIETVLPEAIVVPGLLMASTDTRQYASLTAGVYRFHPYTLDLSEPIGVHGTDEHVSRAGMRDAVTIYVELVKGAAGP